MIRSCINRGHESILEHASITYRVICDRGVGYEWIRHRLASYSQESTRYCSYNKGKFGSELIFIYPFWYEKVPKINEGLIFSQLSDEQIKYFLYWKTLYNECQLIEQSYMQLIQDGAKPDIARAILPNCLKTEIVCTMNIRELRTFFKLRTSKAAHPDIRKLAIQLFKILCNSGLSILFEDIQIEE